MSNRFFRATLLTAAIAPLAFHLAHADIFTWVDASGTVNVSNLTPPTGVRVTSVIHQPAAKATDNGGTAARDAEMQAMKERIRTLEAEVELATRGAAAPADYRPAPVDYRPAPVDYRPAPIDYRPPPVTMVVPYANEAMSWPTPYAASVAPQPVDDCPWNCGLAWGSPIYAPAVVVVRIPNVRGAHPGHRGRHAIETQRMRVSDGARRR